MNRIPSKKTVDASASISRIELARYLLDLAALQADPRTGNPRLSTALKNLANSIQTKPRKKPTPHQTDDGLSVEEMRSLPRTRILEIVKDPRIGKAQLVKLAGARFSIPHSRLERSPRGEVADAIIDAASHEESLDIIASEAKRGGAGRTS